MPSASPVGGRAPRRGDELELVLDALDPGGGVVGRHGEHVVHLRRGAPGERVRVRVRRRRRQTVEAELVCVLAPSPHAVAPRCAHFGPCGGCSYQDLAYAAQLAELGALTERVLAPLGASALIEPVIGCEHPFAYRNKMDFTFASRRWRVADEPPDARDDFALGLHVRGRHDKVLDITRCEIQFEEANAILADARALARELELAPWDLRTHTGLLRHLVLRKGIHTGEILVDLVTSRDAPEEVEPWAERLLARHPEVTTLVQSISTRLASIAVGERERVLFGPGFIRERLGGLEFEVSAGSFFQTNTLQAERLLEVVRTSARVAPGECVFDLYCGAGTLALALARDAAQVWGFELVDAAVLDARRNAVRNGIAGARFVGGDIAATLRATLAAPEPPRRPDVCVVDPPRAGVHPRVLAVLRELAPARIVYVSCNLGAAARDVGALVAAGYAVRRVVPIDLFPHTPHLEAVFGLERA